MIDKWVYSLYRGTTSKCSIEANNDKYVLLKVKHPAFNRAWSGRSGGTTEWLVCEVDSDLDSWGCPKHLWKSEGRLLKIQKEHLKSTYNL